jgi:hypothetical protein
MVECFLDTPRTTLNDREECYDVCTWELILDSGLDEYCRLWLVIRESGPAILHLSQLCIFLVESMLSQTVLPWKTESTIKYYTQRN